LMPLVLQRHTRLEPVIPKPPCIRYWLAIAWIACLAPALTAQTLRLSSASASRGDQITIELSLASPAGKEPLALQWETKIPVASLTPVEEQGFTGDTVLPAGKSLTCAVREKTAASYTSRCILAGGLRPIPNGLVGRLRLRIPVNAPVGEAHIRVENAIAVSRDSKAVPLNPVETVVTVRK